jgi:hypothetical protein
VYRGDSWPNLPLCSLNCLPCPNVYASLEIPILEMDSPLSIGQQQKELSVSAEGPGDFVGQSTTTKLAKLLDRGRVVDYGGWFSDWILVTARPGDASENSRDDRHQKSMLAVFSALLGSLFKM